MCSTIAAPVAADERGGGPPCRWPTKASSSNSRGMSPAIGIDSFMGSKPGSVIHDIEEVVENSLKMVTEGKAKAITGDEIEVQADSLCLHGDTPGAVDMAKSLKIALEREGVEIKPVGTII